MAYEHGTKSSEVATSLTPTVSVDAGLIVAIGTAPLHLATTPSVVNRPLLCSGYSEAVAAFGYSDDWEKYTLCEVMDAAYSKFGLDQVVFINVLDPSTHVKAVPVTELQVTDKKIKIAAPVILSTLKVRATSTGDPLTKNVDYTAAYNDDEELIITLLDSDKTDSKTSLFVEYSKMDASLVDKDDIVGGIDVTTGQAEGLEAVNSVYPITQLIPGQIIAPGWSGEPEVAAVMTAKVENINMSYKAIAWTDIPADTVKKYTDAPAWKNTNNYTDELQGVTWPMGRLSDKIYHLSTQAACCACVVDADGGNVPYKSPSNHALKMNGICLKDGTEVILDRTAANYLNGQGIVTAINQGGWKLWGNRTGCYPTNTDAKDSFMPVRRMFNWTGNTLVTTFFSKVDAPIIKRFVETVVNSANDWLNGLTAREFLLGGRVEFLESENPETDLLNGLVRFHVYFAPPTPARSIEFILEYDVNYFSTLFAA